MATRQLLDGYVQAFLRHASLEVEREEPIVGSGNDVERNVRPGLESAGLAEHDLGLGPLARRALPDRLGREVVEEVGGEVEVGPCSHRALRPRPRAAIDPVLSTTPQPSRREPDHRVDQHQHANGNLRTDQRGSETHRATARRGRRGASRSPRGRSRHRPRGRRAGRHPADRPQPTRAARIREGARRDASTKRHCRRPV
jgi:hypothetical protein